MGEGLTDNGACTRGSTAVPNARNAVAVDEALPVCRGMCLNNEAAVLKVVDDIAIIAIDLCFGLIGLLFYLL